MSLSQSLHALQSQLCSVARQSPSVAKKIHAQIIKGGLNRHEPIPNTLLDAYGKCGLIEDALQLFDALPRRDPVAWASLLTACNLANRPHRALSISLSLLTTGMHPDHFVFASLVKACTNLGALHVKQGKQVHARFLLSPFSDDDVVKSSLVDMYAKFGLPDYGRAVFDSISSLNSISWTAMISGYARSGRKFEAFQLFRQTSLRSLLRRMDIVSCLMLVAYAF
ncbi:Pentatricopeptide repeat-containing protein mitochondrial [Spatholobus suberectus]|nr:Pentatricopeptide repeat-containing protein mitochondrial [Spatholobus suberectus]